jgi:hypothetical protein
MSHLYRFFFGLALCTGREGIGATKSGSSSVPVAVIGPMALLTAGAEVPPGLANVTAHVISAPTSSATVV